MATRDSQSLFLKRQIALLVIAAILIAIVVAAMLLASRQASQQDKWNTLLHNAESTATVLNGMAQNRSSGSAAGFYLMTSNIGDMNRQVNVMHHGDPGTRTPSIPATAKIELSTVDTVWAPMREDAATVAKDSAAFDKIMARMHDDAAPLVKTYSKIADAAGATTKSGESPTAGLLDTLTEPTSHATATGTPTALQSEAEQAQRQVELLRHIIGGSTTPANQGATAPNQRAEQLQAWIQQFRQGNQRLAASGNHQVAVLAQPVKTKIAALNQTADQLLDQGLQLGQSLRVAKTMYLLNSPNLQPAIATLALVMTKHGETTTQRYRIAAYVAGGLALLSLALFATLFGLSQVRLRRRAEENDAHQQKAILRLLDEITNLSNGDLTGNITVTEDFTGAIADSINYTVQTLRELVGTINQTSESIVSAASRTSGTARRMSLDSERQAKDITAVTTQATDSSQQLQHISGQAQKLSEQAYASVDTAHAGAQTVNHTIESMDALREQIQDTAKRIKRLGESSQEIGNITEVIDDIAEQTNTLALNASIQAAMAGESGRGFAVVAGEVQRLAERATTATRRIETLVKTIQTDTNEANVSMERSTSNVVSGAQSAQEAGTALGAIEQSSQELAQTIAQISDATRGQSEGTTKIATTLQAVRQIAVGTAESADQTTKEVGELNTLSDRLRESVAGFKLPDEEQAVEA